MFLRVTPDNHPSMTAAAGTGFMRTTSGGVAPGAQLAFVAEGPHWSGLIEAFWNATNDPEIDLISASTGVASYPNDRQPIFELFLDRISDVTGKPIVIAGRNRGPAFEQAQSGRCILTVGGYQSATQVGAFGLRDQKLTSDAALVAYSSGGPATNGGFGVDVVTPVPGVTGWNCGNIDERPTSIFVGQEYKLPRCWGVGGGTSVATPRAAGAVALLLSAAKQTGLKVTPKMIVTALMISAKPVVSEGMYRQGTGLVQVEQAWEALNEIARGANTVIHASSSAISPLYSYWWRGPAEGSSIYVTRGVTAGETRKFPLDLWMEQENKKNGRFELQIVGDQSNFAVPKTVDLSKRKKIEAEFHSTEPGSYSALVQLRRPGAKFPVAQIPVFVSASPSADQLRAGIEITRKITAENQLFSIFSLPPGTNSIKAQLDTTGDIQPWIFYVFDERNPERMRFDTRNGGLADSFALGDASILGVNIEVKSNYPSPCCNGTYTLKLRATTEKATEANASDDPIVLNPPAAKDFAEQTETMVKGGDDHITLRAVCAACVKQDNYELYVFKSFKDRKGEAQQGIWTYAPVFTGTWLQVVPRDREDSIWKFVVKRSDVTRR